MPVVFFALCNSLRHNKNDPTRLFLQVHEEHHWFIHRNQTAHSLCHHVQWRSTPMSVKTSPRKPTPTLWGCISTTSSPVVWNKDNEFPTNRPAQLLCQPEDAEDPRLENHLNGLARQDLLARVVYDEAHLHVTHDNFRRCPRQAAILHANRIPVVLISATVPPEDQPKLFEIFQISR